MKFDNWCFKLFSNTQMSSFWTDVTKISAFQHSCWSDDEVLTKEKYVLPTSACDARQRREFLHIIWVRCNMTIYFSSVAMLYYVVNCRFSHPITSLGKPFSPFLWILLNTNLKKGEPIIRLPFTLIVFIFQFHLNRKVK